MYDEIISSYVLESQNVCNVHAKSIILEESM